MLRTATIMALTMGLLCFQSTSQAQDRRIQDVALNILKEVDNDPGTMSISGTGKVSAEPDEGYITVGMVTKGNSSADAVRQNSGIMTNLYKTLEAFGLKRKDIQTVQFSVEQVQKRVNFRDDQGELQTKYVPDGFQVVNLVRVTVCDLKVFGDVLDALTQGGANRVQSINFGSSEAQTHTDAARKAAVEDALRRAKIFTDALGVKLGKVKVIAESSYGGHREMNYARMAAASVADSVPVSGGSLTFTANVSITWELEQ